MSVTDQRGLSRSRYSSVAIVLHWTIAAALVIQILVGWRMDEGPRGAGSFALFQLHKSLGIAILMLSLVRLGYRLVRRPPQAPSGRAAWETGLAKTVHVLFYVCLIGLPLTGWVIVSASRTNIPTLLFGMLPWPHIPWLPDLPAAAKAGWQAAGGFGHDALVKLTYALLGLHLAGVFKHQFVDGDADLSRMAPGTTPGRPFQVRLLLIAAGVAAAVLVGYRFTPRAPLPRAVAAEPVIAPNTPPPPMVAHDAVAKAVSTPSAAPVAPAPQAALSNWSVLDGSTLGFRSSWSGQPIEGRFARWTGDIRFSPDMLAKSSVKVVVDLSSAVTGDAQVDSTLPSEDWFDTATHPKATFATTAFRHVGGDRYLANGNLTLRGISRPVVLPFTLKITEDRAEMTGVATLDRTNFGVGKGDGATTDDIPANVAIPIHLMAQRR